MKSANKKAFPNVAYSIQKIRKNKTVLIFKRNNLSYRDIKFSCDKGYFIEEFTKVDNLKINYILIFKSDDISNVFTEKQHGDIKIIGSPSHFGLEFTTTNIYIENYRFHPETTVNTHKKFERNNYKFEYNISGNYCNTDIRINIDQNKRSRTPNIQIKKSTPYSITNIERPYLGGLVSPK